MSQILQYGERMLPAAVLALGLWWITQPWRARRLARRKTPFNRRHEGMLAVFMVLAAGLLWLTVLPELHWEEGRLVYTFEGYGLVNLKPFVIFKHSKILGIRYFLINFVGNIALFLPIGFFPALLWRGGRWWKAAGSGVCLSCGIELCQMGIQRGTDVDDVWLNTLGALAGYWIYRLVERRAPEGCGKFKVTEEKKA